MSQNVDVVKRGYDAFNSGDGQTLASVIAEDVHWRGTVDERVPGAGTFKSRDDALAALERTGGPLRRSRRCRMSSSSRKRP
jgi:ketosteroid isomerase-like protein